MSNETTIDLTVPSGVSIFEHANTLIEFLYSILCRVQSDNNISEDSLVLAVPHELFNVFLRATTAYFKLAFYEDKTGASKGYYTSKEGFKIIRVDKLDDKSVAIIAPIDDPNNVLFKINIIN